MVEYENLILLMFLNAHKVCRQLFDVLRHMGNDGDDINKCLL